MPIEVLTDVIETPWATNKATTSISPTSIAGGPGELYVSSTARDLVVGRGIAFGDRGCHSLKGVPGDWQLFAVTCA
jgi:hypothetical protein